MERQSRIIRMTPTPAGRYVRITLAQGDLVRMRSLEAQACDVRVGDTVTLSPDTRNPRVLLELRPPGAVPFEA